MSSTASSGHSSRSNTPLQDDTAADRLAQLEALLQASLGYGPAGDNEAPAQEADKVVDERPSKKRKTDQETVPALEKEEAVAFRLFSTQKGLEKVVIKEAEEVWPVVADPRVRDVADEPKSIKKKRKADIASTAIDGASVVSESRLQPSSLHPGRVIIRRVTKEQQKSLSSLPRLAYFDAVISPSLPAPTVKPPPPRSRLKGANSSRVPSAASAKRRRRQTLRRPLEQLESVRLRVLPILKEDKGTRKGLQEAIAVKKGNRRLSKERRKAIKRKAGLNAGVKTKVTRV